jgi:D-alanine-D-alanine ligase
MDIVVLAGGTSTERDVSLNSGAMIVKALKKNGHRAFLLDVYLGMPGVDPENIFDRADEVGSQGSSIGSKPMPLSEIRKLRKDPDVFFGPNVLEICRQADIVFMSLHGANGEDGKVQATLELFGIPYTGSDYLGSGVAMDKDMTRQLLIPGGVPMAEGMTLTKDSYTTQAPSFGFPCVVKPCCGGSSVGVSIAHSQEEYEAALAEAFHYEDRIVVEKFIKGREFSIAVVEGEAYPIIEIAPKNGFYDYKNKYQAGSTVETCPAALPEDITKKMQGYAVKTAQILRLDTYSRTDFMLDEDGKCYCLESNTLPGMTPTSLMPQEAAVLGISYEELCEKLIQVSLKKYQKKNG